MESKPNTPTRFQAATPRWRSMSDLHVDITESLEAGKTPEAIASEFNIDLAAMTMRFRQRAEAMRDRAMPPVAGPDRSRFLRCG